MTRLVQKKRAKRNGEADEGPLVMAWWRRYDRAREAPWLKPTTPSKGPSSAMVSVMMSCASWHSGEESPSYQE